MDRSFDCEYVVLTYASDPTQEGFMPVAIASRVLDCGDPRGLTLHVPAVLRTTLAKHQLEYLHELFEDWRSMPKEELDVLFRELRDLSVGSLRVQKAGFCSRDDLPQLTAQVFGANPQFDESTGRNRC